MALSHAIPQEQQATQPPGGTPLAGGRSPPENLGAVLCFKGKLKRYPSSTQPGWNTL